MDLRGIGKSDFFFDVIPPYETKLVTKVTPEWFVCHTTVKPGPVVFSSSGKATVSLFVCPAAYTPSSWHTMLMANWDTSKGWMLDRTSGQHEGTHESIPCSIEHGFQLGPDEGIYLLNSGPSEIKNVGISLVMPTYKEITSDVMKIFNCHVVRTAVSEVIHQWAIKNAEARQNKRARKVFQCLNTFSDKQMEQLEEFCDSLNPE